MVIVRIVFGVLGVIAILMGLAMTLEGGVHYNRYGTAVPSRLTGSVLMGIGLATIISVLRRDLGHRKP